MQSLALEPHGSGRKAKELEGILGWLRSSHTLLFCTTVGGDFALQTVLRELALLLRPSMSFPLLCIVAE